ncbi:hypothetical protein Si092_01298 [Streptococcus infantarius subsp. infantarius]|nr:hypothetical protein [Streptococcus infantarius subsp. infantarius]
MNLTERADTRRETFYKLTNSADVPEVPNSGGRNYVTNRPLNWQNKYVFVSGASAGSFLQQNSSTRISPKDFIAVAAGKKYTISLKELADIDYYFKVTMSTVDAYGVANSMLNRDEWIYSDSYTFTAPENCNYIMISVGCDAGVTPDDLNSKFNIKLEEGNAATDYSQVPEDLGWSATPQVPTQSQRYLWKFEYIYYSDGSVEVTQPVNLSIAGADGTNGQTSYVHFAFADNATGGGFNLTTPKDYMGWYADFNEAASTDPTKYRWSKWKGDQGLPGKPGADGKTSYFHMAYASSADGKTGFSFTDTKQQYQGYYTDFTQANSTDPTKYTWVDRTANVQVGGVNLLTNNSAKWQNKYVVMTTDQTSFSQANGNTRISHIDFLHVKPDTTYTITLTELTSADYYFKVTLANQADYGIPNNRLNPDAWVYDKKYTFTTPSNCYYAMVSIGANFNFTPTSLGTQINIMFEEGNVSTTYQPSVGDTQEQIDSKADQTLTQDQLNALAEKSSLIKAEMEAKATIDTVNQWITAYQNYVKANDADKAKSEQALKDASERILGIRYEVNNLKFVWDAIDTYMSFQNEGLIIGKKDGSAYAKFSDDRISLFSGSSEVMYISQGTLNIANGIFTKTIQIGRFRFETHPADADMLVIRFVGG